MFSVSHASKAGLATIIDSRSPLDKDNTPYHCDSWTRNQDIFFFHIGFILAPITAEPSGNTTALYTLQVLANFWHRRKGHVNSRSLRIFPDSSDNGINFSDISPCDVCALGKSNNNGNAIDPQKGSSSSGNTAGISITDHDEVPPIPEKGSTLEPPPSGVDESTPSPDTTATKAQPKGSEQGGATRMRAQANAAAAPISHEGLHAHQHRETRNLGVLANPAACDAGVEHKMGIPLNYALATSKPLSQHRSDGEVISITNTYTFKAATESSQAARWKDASDKGMASVENHEVVDLAPSGSIPSEKVIGTKWVLKVKAEHALIGRVVIQSWDKSRESIAVAPTLRYAVSRASGWHSLLLCTKTAIYFN